MCMKHKRAKVLELFARDGLEGLDLFVPQQGFAEPAKSCSFGVSHYETVTATEGRVAIRPAGEVVSRARTSLYDSRMLHIFIVPCGSGVQDEHRSQTVVDWTKPPARKVDRIVSVCTDNFVLTPPTELHDRPVTTHWRYANAAATSVTECVT